MPMVLKYSLAISTARPMYATLDCDLASPVSSRISFNPVLAMAESSRWISSSVSFPRLIWFLQLNPHYTQWLTQKLAIYKSL